MQQTFQDKLNRSWTLHVDYHAIDRVWRGEGFKLLALLEPDGAKQLGEDPLRHLKILYEILRPEADKLKIDFTSFVDGFDGDVAEKAGECLQEALINFSQSRLRPMLRTAAKKTMEIQTAAIATAMIELEKIDPLKRHGDAETQRQTRSGGNLEISSINADTTPRDSSD